MMLRRDGEQSGVANYVNHLLERDLTADGVLDEMLTSMEFRDNVRPRNRLRSLHQSRCDLVQLLPRASRILDLGGTDQADPAGSLVSMGYPYDFDSLTIVDLPHHDRHELYSGSAIVQSVASARGPVSYRYHSMADLSQYRDGEFDLVFSGESIEHVSELDGRTMLEGVFRVLRPGGWFCLDTPNRRVTELELGTKYSNPDHKIEYTHEQLSTMLVAAKFEIVLATGMNYVGKSLMAGTFDGAEMAANWGLFADVENCYLLGYFCRVPRER